MNSTLTIDETFSVASFLETYLQNFVASNLVGPALVKAVRSECPDAADEALLAAYQKLYASAELAVA